MHAPAKLADDLSRRFSQMIEVHKMLKLRQWDDFIIFKALRAFRRAKLFKAVFAFLLSCCFAGLHVEEVEKLFQSGSKIEPRGS